MNRKRDSKWLVFEVIFSILAVWIPFYIVKVGFFTADDYLLSYILNGSMGGYTWDLIYTKLVYSGALAFLYQLISGIDWMILFYTVVMILSIYVCIHAVFAHKNVFAKGLTVIIMMIVPYYICFTVVAYLAECAGLIALLYLLIDQEYQWKRYILPVLLFCIGAMIRPITVLSICVLFVPVVLIILLKQKKNLQAWILLVVTGGCIGAPLLIGLLMELHPILGIGMLAVILVGVLLTRKQERTIAYLMRIFAVVACVCVMSACVQYVMVKQAGLEEFYSYTQARAAVVDAPSIQYEVIADELNKIGISEVDYALVRQWIFIDKEKFSEETLLAIADIMNQVKMPPVSLQTVMQPMILLFYLLPLVYAVITGWRASKKEKGWLALSVLMLYILYAMLWQRRRFQYYVAWPLSMTCVLQMAVLSKNQIMDRIKAYVMIVVAGVVLIVGQAKWYLKNGYYDNEFLPDYQKVLQYINEDCNKIYIVDGSIYNHFYFRKNPAIGIKESNQFDQVIKAGSGDSFSSRYYSQMERLQIEDPDRVILELVRDDRVYYVGYNEAAIQNYLMEQLGMTVDINVEYEENDLKVYKYSVAK